MYAVYRSDMDQYFAGFGALGQARWTHGNYSDYIVVYHALAEAETALGDLRKRVYSPAIKSSDLSIRKVTFSPV